MNRSKLIIILSSAILCVVTILCVMLVMILPSLTENTNKLIFVSDSLESYYDGSVLKGESWSMVSGELKSGHTAQVTLAGSQRYVGTSQNLMQVRIVDSNGADVTSDYNIECVPGTLTVKPVNLTITSNSKTKVYDGKPLSDDGYVVVPAYTVPPQHELNVEVTGSITEIGETGNTISRVSVYDSTGKDVTFNFNIIVIEGKLIVTDESGLDMGDVNLDLDFDGIPDLNIDLDGDMLADLNIDLDGDMLADLDIDLDGDMLADLDIDLDGDMLADLNMDLNGDMIPDLNLDLDGDMLADLDIDLDGDMLADLDIDLDGDMIPDLNLDLDGDMFADLDIDLNGDMVPDLNLDLNGDMVSDLNTDIDGDMVPDINIDLDGDGNPDINLDGFPGSGMLDISGNIGAGAIGDLGAGAEKIVCYKVTADTNDKVYLKIANFGSYNGQQWGTPNQYGELILSLGSAEYLTSMAMNNVGKEQKTLDIEIINGQAVMPYYAYIHGAPFINQSDVLVSYDYEYVHFVYYNSGYENAVLPDDLLWYEEQYRSFVYNNYLDIDAETYEYMQMIAEANGFSSSDPNVIQAVASYIQHAAKYDLKYDRALDKEDNIVIKFLDEYKSGICQHYASAATLLFRALGIPARYTVGFVCDTVAGETVEVTAMQAHAWVEVYIDGIGWIAVEVTGGTGGSQEKPNKITVTPAACEKKYDGQPLFAENKIQNTLVISDWISKGYTFVPVVSGERTEPGKSESVITDLQIYDPSGQNVTDQFEIEYKTGVVHVYIEEFSFASMDIQKEYDGTYLEGNSWDVWLACDNFPSYYTWEASSSIIAKIKNVGSVQNSFNINVFNEYGEDVTDMYKIVRQCGRLEVTPVSITVTAGSATASYTGEPLICNDIFVTSGALVEGEYIFDYVVEGSQTDRGRSDNIVKSIVIYNSNGEDVTGNYSIVFQKGTLKVTN
ncbi:MAG: hypothetical protein IKL66_00005 [Clostridia bacterium]|nr:hypothetical protein [Clostridia bacterium]